ncbi:hypothetical protein M409DRAFT_20497 [Zasmidium cellare ATCC 36951]|uniref:Uncharacterized protein n=1 Tax=Zasmidium cellare ATCC 36951 TaxID=1080233 RepID=A0A6A6CQC1_ZASCE|nr:uncharacterized protein M409DRAFT_20497 [Zasmidium cellare ATCC 36951]KAF2169271.1 hypothetical protein M409DRAFT_20497 [Zasmidium cellare ATCC 36951]
MSGYPNNSGLPSQPTYQPFAGALAQQTFPALQSNNQQLGPVGPQHNMARTSYQQHEPPAPPSFPRAPQHGNINNWDDFDAVEAEMKSFAWQSKACRPRGQHNDAAELDRRLTQAEDSLIRDWEEFYALDEEMVSLCHQSNACKAAGQFDQSEQLLQQARDIDTRLVAAESYLPPESNEALQSQQQPGTNNEAQQHVVVQQQTVASRP